MAVTPQSSAGARSRLVPFEPGWAELIASWIHTTEEAYWLAPKTRPPLTATAILRWHRPDGAPFVLCATERLQPVAYGELNPLRMQGREYWLGHLIVDPELRGRRYGLALTRALLREAFEHRGARRVTLVVFPENTTAICCYHAAGMRIDGYEWHDFPLFGRRECLIRFASTG